MVRPTPNGLVRHRHSAFQQQLLDVAQAEGEPEVKPDRLLNDLGRETIPAVADLVHPLGATRPTTTQQAPERRDNARPREAGDQPRAALERDVVPAPLSTTAIRFRNPIRK